MTTRSVWITDEPMPASAETIAAAREAGAVEILHGIPPALAGDIAPGTLGLVEITEPEPDPPGGDVADRYVAAEMAGRAAYDAVLAGKTRTLALIDQANRAKSDAVLAALEAT